MWRNDFVARAGGGPTSGCLHAALYVRSSLVVTTNVNSLSSSPGSYFFFLLFLSFFKFRNMFHLFSLPLGPHRILKFLVIAHEKTPIPISQSGKKNLVKKERKKRNGWNYSCGSFLFVDVKVGYYFIIIMALGSFIIYLFFIFVSRLQLWMKKRSEIRKTRGRTRQCARQSLLLLRHTFWCIIFIHTRGYVFFFCISLELLFGWGVQQNGRNRTAFRFKT